MKDWKEEAERMVRDQIARRGITNSRVLDAMKRVPRHLFVPGHLRLSAYSDQPLPIGEGQTISQPYIVAYMTECLDPKPGDRILEIGTGSGYQAAVLAELGAEVYSIEIRPIHAERARERLSELGYTNVHIRVGNGAEGWKEESLFNSIIVTAAADSIPPPLIDQLKPEGKMILPLGNSFFSQDLVLVEKLPDGTFKTRTLIGVRFVPLV
ncbi:MAG: protein-L-isoaspartate(D-aspartate) O-methyltransferase [Spirochaetales bacterium]|nr:protein-L-isoaspartate(D-aspartate) O-methyltransferase [Spirochaetales bacterium]